MPLTSDHFVNYQKEVGDFCVCNGTTIDLPGDFARKIFSECLYTNTDLISFIVGLSSLGFWMVAQAPQFILNCKLGRAKGLSLCFLLEWLTGDTLNLAGAFLTGQVGTAISTAILFVGMDMMLASQYLLLERPCIKNYHSDDDDDDEEEENGYGDELDNPLLSPDQKLPSRPPPTRALYSVFLPVVLLSSLLVGSLGLYGGGGGVSGGGSGGGSSSSGGGGGMTTLMEVALARGARNVGGSVRGGGRSLLAIGSGSGSAPLPFKPHSCDAAPSPSLVGQILSWASCTIYLLSRIPQIIKNWRRQSVEGLSPILFACAVLGNTTYALGIVVKGQRLLGALPFLIGSVGTLCFDMTILSQFCLYRGNKPKKRRALGGKSNRQNNNPLVGVHGVPHWANSPFQSPEGRALVRKSDAEEQEGKIGGNVPRRASGLAKSYGADEWRNNAPVAPNSA